MSTLLNGRNGVIFAVLVILMAATRFHHIGSALHVPDASLAAFFVGGALLPLTGFVGLMLAVVGVDALAMAMSGKGGAYGLGFCFTISYAALPFALGALWWMGRRIARLQTVSLRNAGLTLVGWWLAASVAFLLTNGGFYWFSGRYEDPHWAEYIARANQYYLPYVTRSLPYLLIAAVLAAVWQSRRGVAANTIVGKDA